MTLTHIFIFSALALILRLVMRRGWRVYLLLGISALAIYVLQPNLPVRGLDFWFPTFTLIVASLSWLLTSSREVRTWKVNWLAVAILGGLILILAFTRYVDIGISLTASPPPQILQIALGLLASVVLGLLLARLPSWISFVWFALLLVFFVVLKTPALGTLVSGWLRGLMGQSQALAAFSDLGWLGYSYVAFRILHTIRDRQTGRLPAVSLAEYVTYVVFFPSFSAGPIDRIERFVGDLRRTSIDAWTEIPTAGRRLLVGLLKKFVIADGLALIALNSSNAGQVQISGWMWLLVYAYTFQIYFDFSGYTDIAIGLGQLLGIKLPENFNAPYLKSNLTQFWNNWHMTLTQWFRSYFFNPFTRALRVRKVPVPLIILTTQISTMVLIGLWHGVTWNFVLWGAWHGVGLFIQNRWSEWARALPVARSEHKIRRMLSHGAGILLTFNFVALGWVFFALPSLEMSWRVFLQLFGVL